MSKETLLPSKQPQQSEASTPLTRTVRSRFLALTVVTAALIMSILSCSCSHSPIKLHLEPLQKKIHPPHPKKLHHGTVEYLTEDTGDGRYYRREFTIPCGYGMLAFNIGPAKEELPYSFDVYDDAYIFSNNAGLCVLYPSYRGYQNGTEPFWEADDPTFQQVPLGPWTKVSHKINKQTHAKEMNAAVKARGGDYVILEKGDFYDPRYYQRLKAVVNSWSSKVNVVEALSAFHESETAANA